MVPKTITTGASILLALTMMTGFAAASGSNPLAIVTGEGGAAAQGAADGSYYADASGATDAAAAGAADAQASAQDAWKNADNAYAETKANAVAATDELEAPAAPQDLGEDEVFSQLDQASQVEAAHSDKVAKAADLDSEYVDAGADLEATGGASAWFKDTVKGVQDAYNQVKGLMGFDTSAADDAKDTAKTALEADQHARAAVDGVIMQDIELPQANPELSGDLAGEHASSVTSSVIGNGQGQADIEP